MSKAAADLIERAERECGGRFDDEERGANVMALIFGALARETGQSNHRPEDDFPAGVIVQHQISPAGQRQRESDDALGRLLMMGVDPADFYGNRRLLDKWATHTATMREMERCMVLDRRAEREAREDAFAVRMLRAMR